MHIKKAFTMIELVFVIVVMGIIAAVALPRFASDNVQEAMDQILSDIRYTQHLALVDNVINPTNASWQSAFWSIQFENTTGGAPSKWAYTIGSDSDMVGNFNKTEAAIDPRDGRPIFSSVAEGDTTVSPKVFISKKFGITNVAFTGGCVNAQYVGFDNFGRPHQGHLGSGSPDYSSIMTSDCTITFTFPSGAKQIQINKETGYAFVVGQTNQ